MKKNVLLFSALIFSALLCGAQKVESNASVLTNEQAQQVAKILRQHNVMAEYCGCCEKSAIWCVKISRVVADSISVTVYGEDLETGERYKKVIEVAETWVPQLNMGRIEKMQCVGQLAKVNCDPCTTPSVPLGNVGKKMLELELDGLMEATDKPLKDNNGKSVVDKREVQLKGTELKGKDFKGLKTADNQAKKIPLERKKIPMEKIKKPVE